jgi:hypothetical protein
VRSNAGKKGASKRWQTGDGKHPPSGGLPLAKLDSNSGNCDPPRAPARRTRDRDPEIDPEGSAEGWHEGQPPPPESVEPEEPAVPAAAESAYDLAKRIWMELWLIRYEEPYQFGIDSGMHGDGRVLQRIGQAAADRGGDIEAVLRHKIGSYFSDRGPWVTENRHPLRGIEREWNKYGLPKSSSVTRIAKAKAPVEPMPSDQELQEIAQRAREANKARFAAMVAEVAAKKGVGT